MSIVLCNEKKFLLHFEINGLVVLIAIVTREQCGSSNVFGRLDALLVVLLVLTSHIEIRFIGPICLITSELRQP